MLVEAAHRSRLRSSDGRTCGFRVVVADGRPRLEGREMARALAAAGVKVDVYTQVSALPYLMPGVTKAVLGAHAVLANGAVMGRVGTSQVKLRRMTQKDIHIGTDRLILFSTGCLDRQSFPRPSPGLLRDLQVLRAGSNGLVRVQ